MYPGSTQTTVINLENQKRPQQINYKTKTADN